MQISIKDSDLVFSEYKKNLDIEKKTKISCLVVVMECVVCLFLGKHEQISMQAK